MSEPNLYEFYSGGFFADIYLNGFLAYKILFQKGKYVLTDTKEKELAKIRKIHFPFKHKNIVWIYYKNDKRTISIDKNF